MEDFRIRPRDRYIQEADWRTLYVLTKNWKSDLMYYKDDLEFLNNLIDKNFILISHDEDIEKVLMLQKKLVVTEKLCATLLFMVNKHLTYIEDLIYNPFKYDSYQFRREHQMLEDKITHFLNDLRANRKEVFDLTEHVIKSEALEQQVTITN